jgi:serine/threonine protein kinase
VNPHRDLSAEPKTESVGIDEFEIFGMIGEGSYGKVYLAQKKKGGKFYAVKAISKQKVTIDKKQHEIFRERQALIMLDHPNIVKMYWSFVVRYPLLVKLYLGQEKSLLCIGFGTKRRSLSTNAERRWPVEI